MVVNIVKNVKRIIMDFRAAKNANVISTTPTTIAVTLRLANVIVCPISVELIVMNAILVSKIIPNVNLVNVHWKEPMRKFAITTLVNVSVGRVMRNLFAINVPKATMDFRTVLNVIAISKAQLVPLAIKMENANVNRILEV